MSSPDETSSIADRVILAAGGSGGLGAAAVRLLAEQGARVVVGYRANRERAEALRKSVFAETGRTIELVEGDISEASARSRYLDAAQSAGGPLHALVCFAGNPARVRLETAVEQDLLDSMRDNYVGPILLARDAADVMREQGTSGSIVLFSTMQAVGIFEGSVNYAVPKAALIYAARILARQWGGPDGIRVNVVAPGVNQAGMALKSIESGKYDAYVEKGIIPRFGRAEDVARVVRLLVEPDNYITGQVICVDGGLTLRK